MTLAACHCCGLVHDLPELGVSDIVVCSRCHTRIRSAGDRATRMRWVALLAGAAFVAYGPAIFFPIVVIERLGQRTASSLYSGTWELLRRGEWFVGGVVFLFSIVLPLVKIVLLLELSLLRLLHRRHQALTYRAMEFAGKWGMLDVLLLALLVMLIKMQSLMSFQLQPAVYAFVACVVLSMLASLAFDPHALWDEPS
ncbi:MAG TPA: paraquat-inducible protein A [Pirellulaceae bacterium]